LPKIVQIISQLLSGVQPNSATRSCFCGGNSFGGNWTGPPPLRGCASASITLGIGIWVIPTAINALTTDFIAASHDSDFP
jgi:hypothetical protein